MKVINWIKTNKFPLMVVAFFLVCLLLIITLFQSQKKDHSLDMANFKLKSLEETRVAIEAAREPLEQIIAEKNKEIADWNERDSETKSLIYSLENKINNLPKQYNEKAKQINNFSDADLQRYFNELPVQPDND